MSVSRTASGLRNSLFELLDDLRAGKVKAVDAKAQCNVAQKIMDTVRMELAENEVVRTSLELERMVDEHNRRALKAVENAPDSTPRQLIPASDKCS